MQDGMARIRQTTNVRAWAAPREGDDRVPFSNPSQGSRSGVRSSRNTGVGAIRTAHSPRRRKNVASRPRVPREDFEDDSSSSSDEEFAKNLPPMVRGKEDVNLFPSDIFPSMKWLRYLREQGRDFERFLLLPPGFSLRIPRPHDSVDQLSQGEVAVYTAAFK